MFFLSVKNRFIIIIFSKPHSDFLNSSLPSPCISLKNGIQQSRGILNLIFRCNSNRCFLKAQKALVVGVLAIFDMKQLLFCYVYSSRTPVILTEFRILGLDPLRLHRSDEEKRQLKDKQMMK